MKDIIGWEDIYCFDYETKTVYKKLRNGKLREKKAFINSHGHLIVGLCRKYKQKQYSIHQLVWMYFNNREVPKGMVLHHVDKCKLNNEIENIQLLTKAEHNQIHYEDHHSQQALNKLSEKKKGKPQSEETKKKISLGLKLAYETGKRS